MGLLSLCLSGCKKQEEAKPVDPSSPQSYMNDKPFLDKLKAQKKSRQAVMARHMAAAKAYEAALKDDPKGERSETRELKVKLDALTAEYRALRQETMKTVQERIAPKKGN